MRHKYRGLGAVAMAAGLILALSGAAMAADPQASEVVEDGTVTIHHVDPDDGPIAGARIRLFSYHVGAPFPIQILSATTDADGAAEITGVARAADGSDPVLLDISSNLETSRVDEAGCTVFEGWLAQSTALVSAASLDVMLESTSKSISLNCPEPTPTPEVDPTPTPKVDPTPTPDSPTPSTGPGGGVLGTVGTPAITPPDTATVAASDGPSGSPFVPAFLLLVAIALVTVPVATVKRVRATTSQRNRR